VEILNDFGFAQSGVQRTGFVNSRAAYSAPTRIALLTSIGGVSSEEAFAGKVLAGVDGIPVFVLGKDALVRNKRAVGGPQDLADVETLEN
jgi:hypothetical protein